MGDLGKAAAILIAGAIGYGIYDGSIDLHSLHLEEFKPILDSMKEAFRYIREDGLDEVKKLIQLVKDAQR